MDDRDYKWDDYGNERVDGSECVMDYDCDEEVDGYVYRPQI